MAWYSSFLRGKDRAFKRAHPYIEDFYTTQQKDEARRQFSLYLVVGIALIFIGLMVVIIFMARGLRTAKQLLLSLF